MLIQQKPVLPLTLTLTLMIDESALLGLGWKRRWDRWKAERHARLMVLYGRFHRI
jgi:hypothetical protein